MCSFLFRPSFSIIARKTGRPVNALIDQFQAPTSIYCFLGRDSRYPAPMAISDFFLMGAAFFSRPSLSGFSPTPARTINFHRPLCAIIALFLPSSPTSWLLRGSSEPCRLRWYFYLLLGGAGLTITTAAFALVFSALLLFLRHLSQ